MPRPIPMPQNASSLAFSAVEDFDKESDERLIAIANACHHQFTGMRRDSKLIARRTGAALLVMKGRIKHGQWTVWLEENFAGSPSTARAYMSVAENWKELESTDAVTLEDCRWILARKSSPEPKKKKSSRNEAPAEAEPTAPDRPVLEVYVDPEVVDEFNDKFAFLKEYFQEDNDSDTGLEIVRWCYDAIRKEARRG